MTIGSEFWEIAGNVMQNTKLNSIEVCKYANTVILIFQILYTNKLNTFIGIICYTELFIIYMNI